MEQTNRTKFLCFGWSYFLTSELFKFISIIFEELRRSSLIDTSLLSNKIETKTYVKCLCFVCHDLKNFTNV